MKPQNLKPAICFSEIEKSWILSLREHEILVQVAEGLASKQIAELLFISPHTVNSHRRNLLMKTGAKNTSELVVVCAKRGLL